MSYYSPLRYPGGKGKLTDYIKFIICENNILDGTYIEPYAGGAGIAMGLLQMEYVSRVVINDLNNPVYSFWHSVLYNTDELCRKIFDSPVDVEEWNRQKEIQLNPDQFSTLDLGFSTFFLNRTNRSGIINGGIIGGKEQKGDWKIDARFNKVNLIKRINKIATYRDRIELFNMDAIDFLRNRIAGITEKTFIYLDPPYYNKGQGLYENHYKPTDHKQISDFVDENLLCKWVITYDNVDEIKALYDGYRQSVYSLNYSVANRYKGKEVMIYSHDLIIPNQPISKVKIIEG